ncbi:MAG: precorrin-2 C(20)-methyltransferase [Candidatus Bathyarchaeia archaeon]
MGRSGSNDDGEKSDYNNICHKGLGEKVLGKLIGVGVGPGNPELVTVKASRILKAVDVVCAPKARQDKPSLALTTVKPILEELGKAPEILELVFPMTRNAKLLKNFWEKNAETIAAKLKEGKNVAFITLGDPMFYSTFTYTYKTIMEKCPEVEVEIIPGVTSLTACAAVSRTPIAEGQEIVAIVPSNTNLKKIKSIAKNADTLVFMKGTRLLKELPKELAVCGFSENSPVVIVKKIDASKEEVKTGRLSDLQNWKVGDNYFSTIIIKRR